jgi:hypothetical protein
MYNFILRLDEIIRMGAQLQQEERIKRQMQDEARLAERYRDANVSEDDRWGAECQLELWLIWSNDMKRVKQRAMGLTDIMK